MKQCARAVHATQPASYKISRQEHCNAEPPIKQLQCVKRTHQQGGQTGLDGLHLDCLSGAVVLLRRLAQGSPTVKAEPLLGPATLVLSCQQIVCSQACRQHLQKSSMSVGSTQLHLRLSCPCLRDLAQSCTSDSHEGYAIASWKQALRVHHMLTAGLSNNLGASDPEECQK